MSALSSLARLGLLAAMLAVAACSTQVGRNTGPVIRGDVAAVRLDPAAANTMLSQYRVSHGLPAVHLDPELMAMAQRQADAMAARGELSHEVAGTFLVRLDQAHVDTTGAGENIAVGYFSLESVFKSWQDSPPHDRNLLQSRATRFGIALAKAPETRWKTYWAMVVANDPPPPEIRLTAGPVRRRVVQAGTLGGSLTDALVTPFSNLFGH
jgi:uncharacterized protein YkwD